MRKKLGEDSLYNGTWLAREWKKNLRMNHVQFIIMFVADELWPFLQPGRRLTVQSTLPFPPDKDF